MNNAAYLQMQIHLQTLAQLVRDMPLHEFIQAADRAETIGSIVDPTLYQEASENLTRIRGLAQALLPFQRVAKEVLE